MADSEFEQALADVRRDNRQALDALSTVERAEPTRGLRKRVLKYPLIISDAPQSIFGDIVHVASQNGLPTVWAVVGPGAAMRRVAVLGTGHDVPVGYAYVGTAHCGRFVWHVFEVWS